MSELEQVLQERIEQLEKGEPLEACLAGLPEQEASALRLIASVRGLPVDNIDQASITAQRAEVLKVAAKELTPSATPSSPSTPPLLAQLQTWLDWLLTRRELAAGLAFVFIASLLGVIWLGLSRGQADDETAVVAATTESQVGEDASRPTSAAPIAEENPETPVEESLPETAVSNSNTSFLPILSVNLELNAQTASVEVVEGVVEIQGTDGTWTAVNRISTLTVGQRVRTGSLSKATLTFFDGSQTRLHANTEISIDELNAQRPEQGFRTVVMTQHVGESEHSVQFRDDGGSRYEVNTPAGSGVARGTTFNVLVTPGLLSQFIVSEGKVDVTGLSQTVSVIAGQTTAVLAGSPPEPPAFRISGEGEVSQIGATWTIAGQTFQTHNQTIIIGNPQVGDLVYVEGRLLADGTRIADRIRLLHPTQSNRFTLTGIVEIIGTTWTVAGQIILIDENTLIDDDIAVGDLVSVRGQIVAGGSLLAREIEQVDDDAPGFPFHFTGVVQAIGAETWTISGVAITVDAETTIDDDIAVGDVVEVRGRILEDGTWLARRITRVEDDLPEFSIIGRVQSIAPWHVASISFEIRDWTAIEPGIAVDDLVRVRGVILEDGTWVAATIDQIGDDDNDDDDNNIIILVGVVNNIDPWIVNGLQLFVTDQTVIVGNIVVGDLVVVRIRLLEDGTWQVLRIRPLFPTFGIGCFTINTLVTGVQPNQLLLQGWPNLTLDDDTPIQGDIQPDSVIVFTICIRFDGTLIIIRPIIVIYQPIIIVVPPAPPPGGGNSNSNDND